MRIKETKTSTDRLIISNNVQRKFLVKNDGQLTSEIINF